MGSSVGQIESYEYDEELLSREMASAKLKNFAKENFQNLVRFDLSRIDFLKWISQHYAYNLPSEIDEYFININVAPYFWASNISMFSAIEKAFASQKKNNFSTNFPEIKKFYSHWVTEKETKEKEYYALYTINLIEHNSEKDNFLQNLLYATIVSFDKRIYSPDKAIILLDESQQILVDSALEEELKSKFLYLINLFTGFVRSEEHTSELQSH